MLVNYYHYLLKLRIKWYNLPSLFNPILKTTKIGTINAEKGAFPPPPTLVYYDVDWK